MSTNSNIRQKLGQLIMMDFRYWGEDSNNQRIPFTKTNDIVNKIFKDYNLGGFILFRENIQNNEQVISLLRDLQANTNTPIFFATDQEGGRVNRLQQGTSGCGNMALAATDNPHNAYTMAKIIGDELYSLGININFAPAVDVNSNKNNPIIGVRSYSDNPDIVIDYAKNAINGYHDAKIIDCIKHFPGHGDTATDSHLGNVNLDKTLKELQTTELLPFSKLARDCSMIMTAHISVPALDDTQYQSVSTSENIYVPATLSYKIITKLLKQQMKFDGLVVSDAMDMHAIAKHFGTIEASKLAILAGIDILLMPVRVWSENDLYKLEELFCELEKGYNQNSNFANAVDNVYTNITDFKAKHKLDESLIFKLSQDEQLKYANQIVNSNKHQQIALDIAKQSTTVVKNSGIIPCDLNKLKNILIVDSDNQRLADFHSELLKIVLDNNSNVIINCENINNHNIKTIIENADLILLISANLREYNQTYNYITSIKPEQTINIAALTPYDINYIDNIINYVCIYGATSMDQTNYTKTSLKINIQTTLENIFGNKEIKGVLPVSL
ncbi:glycoside hydrolase family 3 protein [Francisella tularensis]|uniref:glycoside hydrolase family 3 protein n=1 Tax=Francisella tularensis TaxID=263 RepID=UPI000173E50A|nr:glycoside hydrolase family 3 protein [Francisella tularensis]ACD30827.1 glycosyl hydrolase family 3 [Francisella tularensis subsp. mediasiatica FSC147]MBK2078104.1 glycoside hydrolase family 3 protein [Francisella tularensis subsp. mediasiatica]MBK2100905.1 glycoside hydrolase family 3 protein [Francisella tularensis subsp. mediasiatica]MBK2105134.1 glycoside hydrolase family 3 protein [Francisella tularensis subsp. mediasiatica]MDN9003236.1 glycoside hydrolase family 3 protein [Francisella